MYLDAGGIDLPIGTDTTIPCVTAGIGKVETTLHLLKSDAVAAMVAGRLGVVGVGDVASDGLLIGTDDYMDERMLGGADAMLEGILYQRDEYHRGHRDMRIKDGEPGCHIDRLWQTDAHQLYIVLKKLHFVGQRHQGLLGVVEHMAQQAGQFLYGLLSLGGIEGGEGIDIVEGVEKEMGVNLRAQIAELGISARCLGITTCLFRLLPPHSKPDGGGYCCRHREIEDIANKEAYSRPQVNIVIISIIE